MRFEVVTIFPDLFDHVFARGVVGKALDGDIASIDVIDLRNFTVDRHRTVDDRPYGGGPGMVLKPEPIFRAIESLRCDHEPDSKVVLLSPRGTRFDQHKAKELSLAPSLTLISGRYEGVDQRVSDFLVDEEISLGDFVLSGGEFAAMAVIDAVTRLLPGVVGQPESILEDSFMEGVLDHPQFTRPREFRGYRVPEVLLCGDHDRISRWRRRQSQRVTQSRRPDLISPRPDRGKEEVTR